MRAWPFLLGSVLFAVAGCSSANPSGTAAYRAPGGAGGSGGTTAGSGEGTTDPGVRMFGAEPMGALVVETMPSVRPASGRATTPAPVPTTSPFLADPPAPVQRTPRPPPPPPPPVALPPEPPASASTRFQPRPPPPATAAAAVSGSDDAPWPPQPYPAGMGPPPMPPRPRSRSDVLGPPPTGELPPPESSRVAR